MHVIRTRNVHTALPEAVYQMSSRGLPEHSRYGDVLVFPEPVTTVYERPFERVLFWQQRDANPFLHFFTGLWIIAGRNDVALLSRFAKRMETFSDDGVTLHGAYGFRWRNHFCLDGDEPLDQIDAVVRELKANPESRRCVLSMWDPVADLGRDGKDLPCNTQVYLRIRTVDRTAIPGAVLDITVTNRSNDIIWGCYGANAVEFSMLHEYLARRVGVGVGRYYQVSNNWHAYLNTFEPLRNLQYEASVWSPMVCPYANRWVAPYEMVQAPERFDENLRTFLAHPEDDVDNDYANPFFQNVAQPLWLAHNAYKDKNFVLARRELEKCAASDWRTAAVEWLARRQARVAV